MRRTPEILAKTTANLEMVSTTLDNEVTKHFDKHTVEVNAKQTRTKLFRSDLQVTVVYITVGENGGGICHLQMRVARSTG